MPPSEDSFAAAYARKPATPARGLLPERRVWVAAGGLATLAVLVAVPLQFAGHTTAADPPTGGETQYAYPAAVTDTETFVSPPPSPSSSPKAASSSARPSGSPPKTTTSKRPPAASSPAKPPSAASVAGAPPAIPGRAIVGVGSNLCLSANSGKDGTALTIAKCDGSAVQHWEALSDGTVRSVGLCMDAAWAGTADFTTIQVAKCNGNQAQQWRLNPSNDLVDVQADKCADVYQQGTAPGSPVKLFHCNGGNNQKWYWK
ncbi:ricin-type beta-trefoil lectin domain protein [Dactylosporangium sp. NPDC051541]|uniref:ricin-type beta-trefoil lectin domain protein n=1 Tax=Dactylosporangium sp. NPDC051541 TaxID=3363977 RepID=UPI00379C77C4